MPRAGRGINLLPRFIASFDQVVTGNKMKSYGDLASADERAKTIAVLEETGANDWLRGRDPVSSAIASRRSSQP